MKTPHKNLLFHFLLTCMLLCFLAACGITVLATLDICSR